MITSVGIIWKDKRVIMMSKVDKESLNSVKQGR